MHITHVLKNARIQDVFYSDEKIALKLRKDNKVYELVIEHNEEAEKDPVQKPLTIMINELEEVKTGVNIYLSALERLEELSKTTLFIDIEYIRNHAILAEDWGNRYYILLRNGLELIVHKEEESIVVKSIHSND